MNRLAWWPKVKRLRWRLPCYTMQKDIGLAVLERLVVHHGGRVGYHFGLTEWLREYLASFNDASQYNTHIVREVVLDMVKEGYVEPLFADALNNYGAPNRENQPASVDLAITWKGKAFYLDHVKRGVLTTWEQAGLWAAVIFSFFGLFIAGAQLRIAQRQEARELNRPPEITAPTLSTTLDNNQQRTFPSVIHDESTQVYQCACDPPKRTARSKRKLYPCPCDTIPKVP